MPSPLTIAALGALPLITPAVLAVPSSDHVVTISIARSVARSRSALYKRDTATVALRNDLQNALYSMNVSVGTPPQPITLQLDTGSTDVWFLTPGGCQQAQADPNLEGNITNCGGTYDMSKSSTGKIVPGGQGLFETSYADTTGAQGDYISDILQIGQWSLQDYTMGQAISANTTPGLIGVGFDSLEAIVGEAVPGDDDEEGNDSDDGGYASNILQGFGYDTDNDHVTKRQDDDTGGYGDPSDPDDTDTYTDPTDNTNTDPTDNTNTDPTDPTDTDPTNPTDTDPTDPTNTDPTDPTDTDPTDPTDPDAYDPDDPTDPDNTDPTSPSYTPPPASDPDPDATPTPQPASQPQPQSAAYPAVLTSLLNAGLIHVRSFSLYLDDLDASTGSIIFGGFDTSKFSGSLAMLPMQVDAFTGTVDRYNVALTSVGITTPGSSSGSSTSKVQTPKNYAVAATLDSGTSLSDCPAGAFNALAAAFGAQMDETASGYVVSCDMALLPGSLDYQFGGSDGPVIGVPFSELVIPLIDPNTDQEATDASGKGLCQLGLNPVPDDDAAYEGVVIGDTVLRSAYVYYQLDTKKIGLAQTVFQTTDSHMVEVASNATVPSGAVAAGTAVRVPTDAPTPTDVSAGQPQFGAQGAGTGVTAAPATTFDAGKVTGVPTSYASASLPSVGGNPTARVSAEVKGEAPGQSSGVGKLRIESGVLGSVAVAIGGLLLGVVVL